MTTQSSLPRVSLAGVQLTAVVDKELELFEFPGWEVSVATLRPNSVHEVLVANLDGRRALVFTTDNHVLAWPRPEQLRGLLAQGRVRLFHRNLEPIADEELAPWLG
ncbi:MAG: hypothetical protein WDZ90_03135 [Candidatus Paceibacterota bacterium]